MVEGVGTSAPLLRAMKEAVDDAGVGAVPGRRRRSSSLRVLPGQMLHEVDEVL